MALSSEIDFCLLTDALFLIVLALEISVKIRGQCTVDQISM